MKKLLAILLAMAMCFGMLCACTNEDPEQTTTAPSTDKPDPSTPDPSTPDPSTPSDGNVDVALSDYFGNKDVWDDDGGYVTVDAENGIVFDTFYAGDFASLMLTEKKQDVNYKFSLQLTDIPTNLSYDEGTWWDSELLIMMRSTLAAPGWEDGQTGYSLTAWGDMSEVYIGRAGHDDAFGSIKWNVNDGQPHDIEFSAVNNEDGTAVTLKLIVDGEVVFETVDDGSITKEGRTPLFPNAGNLTLRCKYLKAIFK